MSERSPGAAVLDPPALAGLIEVMFLAAHADGEFSDEERNEFAANVAEISQRRIVGEAFTQLMQRLERNLETSGRPARLSVLRRTLPDPLVRLDVLSIAIRMTVADGVIRTAERELILEVAEAMDIDADVAADLVAELTAGAK